MNVILKCAGIILIWFVSYNMANITLTSFQIQNKELRLLISQLIMLIIVQAVRKRKQIILSNRSKINPVYITGAVFTGIGLACISPISSLASILNGTLEVSGTVKITIPSMILVLSSAVVEEFFYRGIIINLCRSRFNAGATVILSALLFSVSHFSPVMWIHTFVCGILCGYYYYYSGKIAVPVIIHFINNFVWSCLLPVYMLVKGNPNSGGIITAKYVPTDQLLTPLIVSVLAGTILILIAGLFVYRFAVYNKKIPG